LVFQVGKSQEKPLISKRVYDTKPILAVDSPSIDGIIDEKSWDIVAWSSDFLEREPDENTAPSEQTKFKIIYDKKFLYIAFRCYDKDPGKIVKRMSRRDGFEGDWVEINIDSYHTSAQASPLLRQFLASKAMSLFLTMAIIGTEVGIRFGI
jgi:hypothetical protein